MTWVSKNLENLAKVDNVRAVKLNTESLMRLSKEREEQELQEELGLNYRYFRFDVLVGDWEWDTSVSFGWKRVDDNIGDNIVYSFALQSKNDQFSRKVARRLINHRFKNGSSHRFNTPNFPFSEVMLALHYNGMRKYGGIEGRPLYLRKIPIFVGGYVDNFRKDLY